MWLLLLSALGGGEVSLALAPPAVRSRLVLSEGEADCDDPRDREAAGDLERA